MNYYSYPGLMEPPKIIRASPIEQVANAFRQVTGCDLDTLRKSGRKAQIVRLRQALTYFLRNLTEASLSEIGDYLGGQDHTTVLASCRAVKAHIDADPEYREWLSSIHPYGGKIKDPAPKRIIHFAAPAIKPKEKAIPSLPTSNRAEILKAFPSLSV
jgi:hypothetical protein